MSNWEHSTAGKACCGEHRKHSIEASRPEADLHSSMTAAAALKAAKVYMELA